MNLYIYKLVFGKTWRILMVHTSQYNSDRQVVHLTSTQLIIDEYYLYESDT